MATCASCGKEIRDNDWTCGNCGAPVATSGAASGSGAGSSGYGSSYESAYEPPADYGAPVAYGAPAAPAAKGGLSRTTVTIIVVALLAVVAIIAVWFFFVRGTGGTSPFLGTWNDPKVETASVEITLKSGEFKVKMTGTDASGSEKAYTIPAHLDGSELVITVDDFVKATGDEEKAAQAKVIFETLIKDFRIVFSVKDPTHLEMTMEGSPASGAVAAQVSRSSTVLVKAD